MKGFTLIETILATSMIIIIGGLGTPIYHNLQIRTDQNDAALRLVQMSRRAQTLSRSNKHDSAWSIHIENERITLFRGNDYNSRNDQYDETFEVSPAINFTGQNEYTYSQLRGKLPEPVDVTIQAPREENINVNINEMGNIEY